jgi:uncharacterized protein (UPF0332 family)
MTDWNEYAIHNWKRARVEIEIAQRLIDLDSNSAANRAYYAAFLMSARHTGDYGGVNHVSKSEAEETIATAAKILDAVHGLAPDALPLLMPIS